MEKLQNHLSIAEKIKLTQRQLERGLKVMPVQELYPTPKYLADRMAELARLRPGQKILEPSAGTGSLLESILSVDPMADCTAMEIEDVLCQHLRKTFPNVKVLHDNFFITSKLDKGYDRILMNPPFLLALDIKHIQLAISLLNPGGRLVAICADGPRQNDSLRPLVREAGGIWEPLPAGTFKNAGTMVRTALLTFEKWL